MPGAITADPADCLASVLQVSYGGEDAWFTSEVGGGAIGVADGVGGWADSEINPAGRYRTLESCNAHHSPCPAVEVPVMYPVGKESAAQPPCGCPAEYAKTFMLVAKNYLEGKDVRMNDVNGSVRLVPAAGPLDTFDGEGERSPQVSGLLTSEGTAGTK
jgi:hypothetical protein